MAIKTDELVLLLLAKNPLVPDSQLDALVCEHLGWTRVSPDGRDIYKEYWLSPDGEKLPYLPSLCSSVDLVLALIEKYCPNAGIEITLDPVGVITCSVRHLSIIGGFAAAWRECLPRCLLACLVQVLETKRRATE